MSAATPEPTPGLARTEQVRAAADAAGLALPAPGAWPAGGEAAIARSDFLAATFAAHPSLLAELIESGDLERRYTDDREIARRVEEGLGGASDKESLGAALRRLRRREMARIAWRDLGGAADLAETLHDLSAFADVVLREAVDRLDELQHARRGTPMDRDGNPQSLVVFALGKLGAGELNFSSDVDLIFAYPTDGETTGARRSVSAHEYFLELGRSLIEVLQRRTKDGFVFRVDMRLRPFGNAGPLVLSFGAMEDYYQRHGRDWERYALIRMRPVAGDIAAGNRLLARLQPFVFRRYLDFGTLESLREMKAMIAEEVARRELDEHVKLGPGGIREIEFTVQAFQLVRGGRTPALRDRRLTRVLDELAARELLPGYAVRQLQQAYAFLRRVENRLQEFQDRQTHQLPEDDASRADLAHCMGFANWRSFSRELGAHRRNVRAQFDQVLGGDVADHVVDAAGSLLVSSQDETAIDDLLREYGFADAAAQARERWIQLRDSGERRAMDETAERRLKRLLPDLLRAVAASTNPLATLERVLQVVGNVLRRSTYLALLHERPITMSHFVRLCAASPWIAHQLAGQPQLLDELLDARTLYSPPAREELEADLEERLAAASPGDAEEELAALRQFRHRQVLRVAAADIADALPLMKVSDHLSDIAEVVLSRALALAQRDLVERHGTPRGDDGEPSPFVIVGYGKLGGLELGYGSDLDLVFLHGEATSSTDGPRPLHTQAFLLRLAQRIVYYLTTTTRDGTVYPVDTRLRPHGNDGVLACSLATFERYQHEHAWTWEHQALVRARVVAGDPTLGAQFEAARERVLLAPRDPDKLLADVCDMRARMRSELGTKGEDRFNIKQDVGGITDIEFMVQYAALRWGERLGAYLRYTDNIRLLEGLEAGGLLEREDTALLNHAYQTYRACIHRLSLQEQPGVVPATDMAELRAQVARIWGRLMEPRAQPAS